MTEPDAGRFELAVGRVLHVGSLASTLLLASGLALAVAAPEADLTVTLLVAGLIVLMATPVARVVVSVIEYAIERDWAFVALTVSVLLVLTGSLMVAMKN